VGDDANALMVDFFPVHASGRNVTLCEADATGCCDEVKNGKED